jgi:hypothetical protein
MRRVGMELKGEREERRKASGGEEMLREGGVRVRVRVSWEGDRWDVISSDERIVMANAGANQPRADFRRCILYSSRGAVPPSVLYCTFEFI